MQTVPKTLLEVIRYFSDKKNCVEFVKNLRWPDGSVACPKCGTLKVKELATRQIWQCGEKGCRKQFSVKVGTIFEDSALTLDKWLIAMWMISTCRNGVSSYEIARSLGITQKSAWFLLHRVRECMRRGTVTKLTGTVEVDETYIGGLEKNKHSWKKVHGGNIGNKVIAMGLVERDGDVIAKVVDDTTYTSLSKEIELHVEKDAKLYTDEWRSYMKLGATYDHFVVNHGAKEYVRGNVHTNTIESFWSLLKRGLKGTYIHVAPFHLDRYIDEQALRFNLRKGSEFNRLEVVTAQSIGRRLTWNELTGKAATE